MLDLNLRISADTVEDEVRHAKKSVQSTIAVLSLIAVVISTFFLVMKLEDVIDDRVLEWITGNVQSKLEEEARSQHEDFRNYIVTKKHNTDNLMKEIMRDRKKSERSVSEIEEVVRSLAEKAMNGPITAKTYRLEVPAIAGTTRYDANVRIDEFPAAVVGGWTLYPEAILGEEVVCKYTLSFLSNDTFQHAIDCARTRGNLMK